MVLAHLQKIPRGGYATRGSAAVLRVAQPGFVLLLRGFSSFHCYGGKAAIEKEIAAEEEFIRACEFACQEGGGGVFGGACGCECACIARSTWRPRGSPLHVSCGNVASCPGGRYSD